VARQVVLPVSMVWSLREAGVAGGLSPTRPVYQILIMLVWVGPVLHPAPVAAAVGPVVVGVPGMLPERLGAPMARAETEVPQVVVVATEETGGPRQRPARTPVWICVLYSPAVAVAALHTAVEAPGAPLPPYSTVGPAARSLLGQPLEVQVLPIQEPVVVGVVVPVLLVGQPVLAGPVDLAMLW